jgi:hypothetical protein
MRYQDFIAELRQAVELAQNLQSSGVTHEDTRFREWRYRTESLVAEAEAQGYMLPGSFSSSGRNYRDVVGEFYGQDNHAKALVRDIGDSIIELNYLISRYDSYGQPPMQIEENDASASLTIPERVTLAWLYKHVAIGQWGAFAVFVFAVFLFGVAAGRTDIYAVLEAWFKSLATVQ